MRVYAVASISGGDPRMPTHATPADRYGGCSPAWNSVFHFPIPAGADTRGLALHVLLRADRAVLGSRNVGEVFVPVDDLIAGADRVTRDPRPATYQVRRPRSGRAHGVLYFCYKFIDVPAAGAPANSKYVPLGSPEKVMAAAEKAVVDAPQPVATAYPPPASYQQPAPYGAAYAGYPPPQSAYPYAAPSPYGYGAAPPQYGYAAAPVPAKKHGGGGMGMGLGLGILGGMMVGEMIGDAEADAAYNTEFDDALEL
ncbi:hypothetical protein PR202_gb20348 [Eleusine coracana subsp. coracana]|uniref:C2 domain-containing protein n=1 Tax=Eleusine coracana subsp. coracana TaxID=191504 RepID=A0AAV5FAI4_ELECO|nr:hypothetical protein PR202_gb20348 [Eleusine coracana subsp. coracana]